MVRSIYYDSRTCECYSQKISGIKVRNKFRIRGYNTGNAHSPVFFEIKRKNNNFISKSRSPLPFSRALTVLNMNGRCHGGDDSPACLPDGARNFLFHYHSKNLKPTTLVVYDREAYYGKYNTNLRLTFDKNLRRELFPDPERLFDDTELRPVLRDSFIFEVKFYGSLPGWLRALICTYALPRMALSKYTNCLNTDAFDRQVLHQMMLPHDLCGVAEGTANERIATYAG